MTEIEKLQLENARRIFNASHNNDLVVFVGAGVSVNSGVPDWDALIVELKKCLPDSIQKENDYLKVAQIYKESFLSGDYLNSIQAALKDEETRPNLIHDAILRLDPCHIITTNYDSLIEKAVENARCHYSIIRDDKDIPFAKSSRYIIKMHGDFVSKRIVLTESDYLNYSSTYPLIDTLVKSIFGSKTILCVGFSFNDLNLKIILNRIQSMLGKNAKPVYLLADYNENPVLYNYLKNKGIQPFWLPTNITDKYCKAIPDEFNNLIGANVYKQLSCLKYDVSKPLDLIDALYSYSQMVEREMPFFYLSRLRKILPDNLCKWDHTYSMGIQLESEYINTLVEQCKDFTGKRKLLKEKGGKIHSLIQTAANNCIFEFDNIKLWKLRSFNKHRDMQERDCCAMFLDFDFKGLTERITQLEQRDISYSNRDLELPFIKWLLGDLISAYEIFETLERYYWSSNKAILFFICVFNKLALFEGTFPLGSLPLDTLNALYKKASTVDLNRVLSDLALDTRVKDNLSDLINNQYYLDAISSISNLENEILEDKYKSEHGGFSINSHLDELISKLARSFDYSYVNYIITTNTKCAYETYRNGIIGLLNGHTIKSASRGNGHFSPSRIEFINVSHLKLMIFTIEGKDLSRIFDIYQIASVSLNTEASIYLRNIIDNIQRDSEIIKKDLRIDILKNRLSCLFLLYSKAINLNDKTSDIVDIAINYNLLSDSVQYNFYSLLSSIIINKKYTLSESQCRAILSYFPDINRSRGLTSLFYCVVAQMKSSGWMIKKEFDKNDNYLSRELRLNEMYLYYDILPEASREVIRNYLYEMSGLNNRELLLLCSFITNKQLINIANTNHLEKIYSLRKDQRYENKCYQTLKYIYDNSKEQTIKEKLLDYCEQDPKLRFILEPLKHPSDINLSWLRYIDDHCFGELIKDHKVSRLFMQDDIDQSLLRRYVKLLSV